MQDALPTRTGLTLRAFLLGVVMVAIVTVGAPFSSFILNSTYLATNYFPLGAVFPFFVLVAIVNVALKAIKPGWAFKPAELIASFMMGLVAAAVPTYGLTGYLISVNAAPYYFASPENRWSDYFHEHIPAWICPTDVEAMKWFFEGVPVGQAIPWSAWLVPMIWWALLLGSVLWLCLCLIVILRKQWIEKERLTFPLAEIPVEMVEESDSPRLTPKFMQSRLFWYGFSLTFLFICWNMIGYFVPGFPAIPRRFGYVRIGRGFPAINTNIYPPMTGVAFLLHLDVSFSVWFFYILGVVQTGLFNRFGFTIGSADTYCSAPAAMGWQGFGAFTVMVMTGLWMARDHLRDVLREAWHGSPRGVGPEEVMSYRAAVLGVLLSLLFIGCWMGASGMSLPVIVLFLFAAVVLYIGLTRIVIEGGLVFLRGPIIPQSFACHVLGTATLSPACLTAISFSYGWFCDIIACFMPSGANSVKMGERTGLSGRGIFIAIVSALVIGFAISLPLTLYFGYRYGAYNFNSWVFRGGAATPFANTVTKLKNASSADLGRLGFLGIGAVVMAGLQVLRYRLSWWPLHPFGFPLAAVLQVKWSCFSIVVGWAAKLVVLRLGGIGLYRKAKPFFIGLIMGFFFGSGVSFFVDWIAFFGEGHRLYL